MSRVQVSENQKTKNRDEDEVKKLYEKLVNFKKNRSI